MIPLYRSRTSTFGRRMASARSLWRATGLTDADFGKPIIAVVNAFTQFVPGHVPLKEVGGIVAEEITRAGAVAREFNTIAIDDGIAMGHAGMLYSLPSRELIADSVEYMVNAHCADAMLCLASCDKIIPGMLMAALRLNLPTVFVASGPMEAGKLIMGGEERTVSLVDVITAAGDDGQTDATVEAFEQSACPTCGSCSGLFTANSMNCLLEALGLALPGNGSLLATHTDRDALFRQAARTAVKITRRYYEDDDQSVLPRSVASLKAFENAMTLDIAMGGSTNTVLHLLAAAHEAGVAFTLADIDRLSQRVPHLVKIAPATQDYYMEHLHRAGGVMALLGELDRGGLLHRDALTVYAPMLGDAIVAWDVRHTLDPAVHTFYRAAPGGTRTILPCSQTQRYLTLERDRVGGCIRDIAHAYSTDGGLAVLYGNLAPDGCIVKTAGVDTTILVFSGPAVICESQEEAVDRIISGGVRDGDVIVIRYEGPKGGPGMQEMLYPTSYLKAKGLDRKCALVTDGRFSGGTSGLSVGHVSPEAAEGGAIALLEPGDYIHIDIPARTIHLAVETDELEKRRRAIRVQQQAKRRAAAWMPARRNRPVSAALQAYALLTTSAARGAVRDLTQVMKFK